MVVGWVRGTEREGSWRGAGGRGGRGGGLYRMNLVCMTSGFLEQALGLVGPEGGGWYDWWRVREREREKESEYVCECVNESARERESK